MLMPFHGSLFVCLLFFSLRFPGQWFSHERRSSGAPRRFVDIDSNSIPQGIAAAEAVVQTPLRDPRIPFVITLQTGPSFSTVPLFSLFLSSFFLSLSLSLSLLSEEKEKK